MNMVFADMDTRERLGTEVVGDTFPVPRMGERVNIYNRVTEKLEYTVKVVDVAYTYYGGGKIQVYVYCNPYVKGSIDE